MANLEQRIQALAQELQDEILTYVTHYEPQVDPINIEKKRKFEPRCFHVNRAARKNAMSAYCKDNVFLLQVKTPSLGLNPLSTREKGSFRQWAADIPSQYSTGISAIRLQLEWGGPSSSFSPQKIQLMLAKLILKVFWDSSDFRSSKLPIGAFQINTKIQQPDDGSWKETWVNLAQLDALLQQFDN